jgi:NADPH-dependent F420 reductase
MDVTIIGSGNMGRAIGTRFLKGGHNVTLIDHHFDKAEELAKKLTSFAQNGARVQAAPSGSRITDEIVVLAVPYGAAGAAIEQYGRQLAGKIVIDISNPLNASYDGLAVAPGTSAAEEIAKALPENTKVLKAFNTTFAKTLINGKVEGKPLDVFIAGNDPEAKNKVSQVIQDGGLRAIDAGPLSRARQLEQLGFLGISLQNTLGTHFQSAWKILA